MRKRRPRASGNGTREPSLFSKIGTLLITLFAVFMFCEHVVFRFVLVPDDVLHNVSVNDVIRYVPKSRAIMRHPDRSRSLVTINEDGWNSTKPAYVFARRPGVVRIAVVGDSYVHGAFVDVDKAFPEIIERELNQRGIRAEVYRFGIDGAPMSQYLHMLRQEVVQFRPDIVVVQAIHNDFDESYRFLHTRVGSSFMKLGTDRYGRVSEIAPRSFKRGFADVMRNLRTFRYLYYETNAYLKLKWLISKVYWGGQAEWNEEFISSAVDIRNLKGEDKAIRFYTRHMLGEMKRIARENGFAIAFAMDGVREAVYTGRDPKTYEVGKLNAVMAELTRELDLPYLDLQSAMADAFNRTGKRLEFSFDWHWNELGNEVVGKAISEFLLREPSLQPLLKPTDERLPDESRQIWPKQPVKPTKGAQLKRSAPMPPPDPPLARLAVAG
jgi:hypothetical protein